MNLDYLNNFFLGRSEQFSKQNTNPMCQIFQTSLQEVSILFYIFQHDWIMNILLQVSWILYQRLVHRWKETNLSLLPWKSRPEKNVSKSLGKATYDVRSVIRLVEVACMLAADYFSFGPRNQLDFGFGMTRQFLEEKQHNTTATQKTTTILFFLVC